MNYNPLILTDFYKACHHAQYNEDLEFITSYYTPRMSRIKGVDKIVNALIQAFIGDYLVEQFNENFFKQDKETVMNYYHFVLNETIGSRVANEAFKRVSELHDLGYLPLEIKAIKEGTLVPIKVPILEITNTHKNFAWLVNALESLISTSLWHGMISATVGYQYRQIANKWYSLTSDMETAKFALGDFSFRGQESSESAIRSSSGFLLSHMNTATVAAIPYLSHYYNTPFKDVGRGGVSTEHSVMCSNYSIDGDEETFVKKLITEIYPDGYVSIVSDSYDYWNMVNVIFPSLKKEILERDGVVGVRGDSGDPVEIVSGKPLSKDCDTDLKDLPLEDAGTVEVLWRHFGGHINSKGYKVLNEKIKVIYGDSITQNRAEEIFKRLEEKGFSAECVSLGVGSFSMQAREEDDGSLSPYTRDTFGVAIKATHGIMKDGSELFILKDPKTDSGNFKKSLQGLVDVRVDRNEELYAVDKISYKDKRDTIMVTMFKDGNQENVKSLGQIRNKLHNNNF